MEQSIKDKYKLSEEEHNKIYKEIEKEVFVNSTPQDEPIAIIVGGQPGCGKGGGKEDVYFTIRVVFGIRYRRQFLAAFGA